MSDRLQDVSDEITPEQKLGTLLIQAMNGGYTTWVSQWAWEMYGKPVNFGAMQFAFDEYVKTKAEKSSDKPQDIV